MKTAFKTAAAVALTLAVGLVALAFVGADPALAATHAPLFDGTILDGFTLDRLVEASPGLVALRAKLTDLTRQAEEKQASITYDMDETAVRTIEQEHEALLRQVEETRAAIAEAEREETAGGEGGGNNEPAAGSAADILSIGRRAGMDMDDIETAIRDGVTVEDFRTRAFDHLAGQSNSTRTDPARVQRDERETTRAAMVEAMSYGLGAPVPQSGPSQAARGYMDLLDVPEFAARALGHRGRLATVREREELLARAFHSTSDFPAIFSDAINTMLDRRYALAEPTYRRIARRGDFMDFRPHYSVGIGEFPMLKTLTEAGEIRFGTFGESKETVAVVPYARGIRLTRQMLVNDRLGALAQLMGGYGRTVSRFEEITFYTMMLSANTKLADGKVVFHADHGNLGTGGSASAINTAGLSAGKKAMRKQKGLDDAKLNITPKILLVSPDKEDEALQYLSPILAGESAKVNIHVGTLEPVVSAELDGNAWYLFADPEDAAVYRYGLLDGYSAPRVRFDEPFGTQGVGMTVEHDFGVGAIDYRGGYKNTGA